MGTDLDALRENTVENQKQTFGIMATGTGCTSQKLERGLGCPYLPAREELALQHLMWMADSGQRGLCFCCFSLPVGGT